MGMEIGREKAEAVVVPSRVVVVRVRSHWKMEGIFGGCFSVFFFHFLKEWG